MRETMGGMYMQKHKHIISLVNHIQEPPQITTRDRPPFTAITSESHNIQYYSHSAMIHKVIYSCWHSMQLQKHLPSAR